MWRRRQTVVFVVVVFVPAAVGRPARERVAIAVRATAFEGIAMGACRPTISGSSAKVIFNEVMASE